MRSRLTIIFVAAALGASVLVPVPGAASEPLATTVVVGDVTKALDEVLDEAPAAIKELVANTAADIEDLKIYPDGDVVVELETGNGLVVKLPADAEKPVVLETEDGVALRVDLPGSGDDAEVTEDGSVVYQDAVTDTDVVVQAQADGGVRIITVIDGSDAPTTFDFTADLDGAETLTLHPDGSVVVTDSNGEPVYHVPEPWAYDANGESVPAWYTITGDTLVLNVDHTATNAYPIIADPWWNPFTWTWSGAWGVIRRGGNILYSHARRCLGGAARFVIPSAAVVTSGNIAARLIRGTPAIKIGAGPWVYVGAAVAGCLSRYVR